MIVSKSKTDVVLQKLCLRDCETEIQRSYYDWGREYGTGGKDKVDPDWVDADDDQRMAVALRGYSLYDGCIVPADNVITARDAWVTAGFRSRIVEADVVRILARAGSVAPHLSRIRPEATLEDATEDEIGAAEEIVGMLTSAPHIGRAKATKLLHKKRPGFMPVLDSVVSDLLWKNFAHIMTESPPFADVLRLCRKILESRYSQITTIQSALAERGFVLTTVRTLDYVLWIGWKGKIRKDDTGPPITQVWGTENLPEARSLAQQSWPATI